jgi:uncharacterized protein (TIGR00369 family)
VSEQSEAEASLEMLNAGFRDYIPHNKALGFHIIEASFDPAYVIAELPWDERLVGHPDLGIIHGGAATTLLDAAGGAAVYMKLKSPMPIATLDLRIDYLKPASGKGPIRARAECIKVTKNVAFVRASAYQDDPNEALALASATYMISTKGQAVIPP